MDNAPKIKDLNNGIVKCSNCKTKINIDEHTPLSVVQCECHCPVLIPICIKTYWLYQPLGAGGMGSVYKAIDEETNSEFAVKVLPRERKHEQELINALVREAEIGSSFGEHPHIISVYDYGYDEETDEYFMVTGFSDGERLDNLLNSLESTAGSSSGFFSERQALKVTMQVLDALTHIGECGYLFRDLKPENVMIEEGNVRLFDYGLCMSHEEAGEPQESDMFEGSPYYVPPERIVGSAEGEYSEIYSLGMLWYFMLTGRTYYSEADLEDLVSKHLVSLRINSVENRLKHCTPGTATIMDKMIARKPSDRIPDYDLLKPMLTELWDEVEKDPHTAQGGSFGEGDSIVVRKTTPKKMAINLIAAIVIIVIGVGAVVPFLIMEYNKRQEAKRSAIASVSKMLKVSPDVKAPDLSFEEVKKLVEEKIKTQTESEINELKDFDESKVKADIYKNLKLNPNNLKSPTIPLTRINSSYSKEYNHLVQERFQKEKKHFNEDQEEKKILKDLHIKDLSKKPKLSVEEVTKKVHEYQNKAIKEKYSPKTLTDLIMKAQNKYQAYKVGDYVKIDASGGHQVSGKYKGRSGAGILVGHRKVLMSNIPMSMRWKFSKKLSNKKATEVIQAIKNKFYSSKKDYAIKYRKESTPRYFAKFGYYKSKTGKWLDAQHIVQERLDQAEAELKKENNIIQKKIKSDVSKSFKKDDYYRKNHYCRAGKKWLPEKKALEELLAKRKKEFEKNKKNRTANITKNIRNSVENEIYPKHGYIKHNNKWQAAKSLFDEMVDKQVNSKSSF